MSNLSAKKHCIHCGNNPTNHTASYIANAVGSFAAPFHAFVMQNALGKSVVGIGERALPILASVWFPLGVAKWNDDLGDFKIARGKVLWEEAKRRGIPMENLEVFGKPTDIYRADISKLGRMGLDAVRGEKRILGASQDLLRPYSVQKVYSFCKKKALSLIKMRQSQKPKWMQFQGLPRPGGESESPALLWIDDKAIFKKKLVGAGIPTPMGASFVSYKKALAHFRALNKPVITKPRFGSRGRHTTTMIQTEKEFEKAFRVAQMLCPYVIVEEHLVGPVYRGTVVGGKTVGILSGEPPRITGDGVHSINDLIQRKNEKKEGGVSDASINDAYLMRLGYDRDSILPGGMTIDLTEKIGVSYGGRSVELTKEAHPKFFTYLEQAEKVINDPILGFDFIAEDVTKDPDSQKWGIIECNGAPFINLHHDPLVGEPVNVAGAVWDLFN